MRHSLPLARRSRSCSSGIRSTQPGRPSSLRQRRNQATRSLFLRVSFLAITPAFGLAQQGSVAKISCDDSKIIAGNSVSCTVLLDKPAPSEGGQIALISNNSTATVPATVEVSPGATSASFTVSGANLASDENTVVTATALGSQSAISLALVSAATPVRLVVKHSGKCLTVKGAATIAGALLEQLTCTASANQEWYFTPFSDGSYSIRPASSALVVDAVGIPNVQGEAIYLWTPYPAVNERFKLLPTGTGYYHVVSMSTNMCLGIPSSTASVEGAIAHQYGCWSADYEAWQVIGISTPVSQVLHHVTLGWAASKSPGVSGYYVYRSGTSTGPWSRLSGKLTATNYVDAQVQAGATYYYTTTAVNATGQESAHSNAATAKIPKP